MQVYFLRVVSYYLPFVSRHLSFALRPNIAQTQHQSLHLLLCIQLSVSPLSDRKIKNVLYEFLTHLYIISTFIQENKRFKYDSNSLYHYIANYKEQLKNSEMSFKKKFDSM